MATNQILQFAGAGGANVLTPSAYAALPALTNGFTSGIAISQQLNTVWRQSSFISAMIAQFIADNSLQNVNDDGNLTTLGNNFISALANWGGLPGSSVNLVCSVTSAGATQTITADQIIVATALGGHPFVLTNFSQSFNLAASGAGGMDTGSAPTSGYVGIYAIHNTTTGAASTLVVDATSTNLPKIYAGANMPAGYNASALISVLPTDASVHIPILYQTGTKVYIHDAQAYSTSSSSVSYVSVSISALVPRNAKTFAGTLRSTGNPAATTQETVAVAGTSTGIGAFTYIATAGGTGFPQSVPFPEVPIITPQTMFVVVSQTGGGTITGIVNITEYTI